MIDCGFPVLKYSDHQNFREWGRGHGEQFRDAIQELASIRRNLMRSCSGSVVVSVRVSARAGDPEARNRERAREVAINPGAPHPRMTPNRIRPGSKNRRLQENT